MSEDIGHSTAQPIEDDIPNNESPTSSPLSTSTAITLTSTSMPVSPSSAGSTSPVKTSERTTEVTIEDHFVFVEKEDPHNLPEKLSNFNEISGFENQGSSAEHVGKSVDELSVDESPVDESSVDKSQDTVYSGYLTKEGSNFKTWHKRYFILKSDGILRYYKSEKPKQKLKGTVKISMNTFHIDKTKRKQHCLKINRSPKPFYAYADSKTEIQAWIDAFQKVQGIYTVNENGKEYDLLQEIQTNDVITWRCDHVKEWLRNLIFHGNCNVLIDRYGDSFEKNSVDGKSLLNIGVDDDEGKQKLKSLGVKSLGHQKFLFDKIQSLKIERVFIRNESILYSKIRKILKPSNDGQGNKLTRSFTPEQAGDMAKTLASVDGIVENYLCTDEIKSKLGIQDGNDEESDKNSESQMSLNSGILSTVVTTDPQTLSGEASTQTATFSHMELQPSEISAILTKVPPILPTIPTEPIFTIRTGKNHLSFTAEDSSKDDNIRLPVKLVITEISHSPQVRNLRKIVSPILHFLPTLRQEFGIFHTAIIVGPWYMEWNDSSLCIPRRIHSSMALLSIDLDVIETTKEKWKLLAMELASVILDWNVQKSYQHIKHDHKNQNEVNCQDFVDAILLKIGMKLSLDGALASFVSRMKIFGHCELEFCPNGAFKKKFKKVAPLNRYIFNSHKELDEFVIKIVKVCPTFSTDFPAEWKLLQSFDRAYWLRYITKHTAPKYTPLIEDEKIQCPFGDPSSTL